MADQNIKVKIDLDVTEFNKNAKALSAAISNVLGKDVDIFNGKIQETARKVDQASNAMGRAAGAAGKASGAVKQSNQQWTALALVIQDLPFGFRGIQNNLPAVAGSLAGVAGPAYLAFSALVAAITAYDMGLFGAKKTTDDFGKSLKEVNDELKKARDYTTSQEANLESLLRVGLNLSNSEEVRRNALKDIKKVLGDVNKEEADNIKTIEEAIIPVKLYTAALKQKNMQETTAKQIAELNTKVLEQQQKIDLAKGIEKRSPGLMKMLFGYSDIDEMELELTTAKGLIRSLESTLDQANKKTFKNPFAEKKDVVKPKLDIDTTNLDLLKSQQKYYKDDLDLFYYYGDLILIEEEKLAVQRAKFANASEGELARISKKFDLDKKINKQEFGKAIMAIAEKNTKNLEEEENKQLKSFTESYQTQLGIFDDFYRDKQNLSTGDRLQQKYLYQQEASDLQYMLENNLITYEDYFKRIGETFKAFTNNNKAITQESLQFLQQIGIGIMNALGPSMDMILEKGATIGEVLEKMAKDLIKQLLKVAATAAITALLMSVIFPKDLVKGGITGMGLFKNLFTQGMGLGSPLNKVKTYANGGVISGPTMGLMGEYPGASHNPEVVAPLDKLKSMIGGGGNGQFVLKGQDLILAINRSNTSLNLKR